MKNLSNERISIDSESLNNVVKELPNIIIESDTVIEDINNIEVPKCLKDKDNFMHAKKNIKLSLGTGDLPGNDRFLNKEYAELKKVKTFVDGFEFNKFDSIDDIINKEGENKIKKGIPNLHLPKEGKQAKDKEKEIKIIESDKDKQLIGMGMSEEELCELLGIDNYDSIESIENEAFSSNKKIIVKKKKGNTEEYDVIEYILTPNQFVFDNISKYKVVSLNYNGNLIQCNINADEKARIRESIGLDSSVEIHGVYYANVGNCVFPVHWIGNTSLDVFSKSMKDIEEKLNCFPPNVTEYIYNNSNYIGFFLGEREVAPSLSDSNNWLAYAHYNQYIYILNTTDCSGNVVLHEFGHIIDAEIGHNQNIGYFSNNDEKFINYYNEYVDVLPEIANAGKAPNVIEFFAQAVTAYCYNPADFKATIPDLYKYMNQLLSGLN